MNPPSEKCVYQDLIVVCPRFTAAFGVSTVGIYCDHDPGLVGIVGGGYVASTGGRRIVPTAAGVQALLPRFPAS